MLNVLVQACSKNLQEITYLEASQQANPYSKLTLKTIESASEVSPGITVKTCTGSISYFEHTLKIYLFMIE